MAYFKFADAIMSGKAIDIYNNGQMSRDFTYVDDVINGIEAVIDLAPTAETGGAPHRVYNLGNNKPEQLMQLVTLLERELGRPAIKNYLPMQAGDVTSTYADIEPARRELAFTPHITLAEGLGRFAKWYKTFRLNPARN